jgi:signal transduction histidine kinase
MSLPQAKSAASNKASILLVDDQPARLLSYHAILAELNQNLVQARSGEEALQRLMETEFAAVLLDVNMPGMDGFETAALIHQHPRFEKTPIIFVTAVHMTDLDRLKGYELGAVDYVYVPVVPEILRGKVQVLVELYVKRRELEALNLSLEQANADLAHANNLLQVEKARELEGLNTILEQANAELGRANRSLEAADARKDEFLAMLSHELRNPLAAIHGAVTVMEQKMLPDPQLVWAREVLGRQTAHLTRLIEDLLDVSRITRGKVTLQKEPVELRSVVAHAIETTRVLIESRRHRLTVNLPQRPLWIDGDPVRLAQIMGNLLTNAAKYTEEGGHIELSLEKEARDGNQSGSVLVRVKDNGTGIPADMLPQLFEPFTHTARAGAASQTGLGIGLAVVRGLVEMHGGSIEAHSEGAGQGSEFVVRLSLIANEPVNVVPAAPKASLAASRAERSLRVLVVDDNVDSASSVATLLELQGHEVQVAHAGQQALRAAFDRQPDVILLDIGLPGMSGYEVASSLREHSEFSEVVLIAMTGYGRESDIRRAEEAGFDHHLVKPVDYEKLTGLLLRQIAL